MRAHALFDDHAAIERMQNSFARCMCLSLQVVKYAYRDCSFPSIPADLPIEGFRGAFRDDMLSQIHAKGDEYRAIVAQERVALLQQMIACWRSDHIATKRMQDQIAHTLCVSPEAVAYAFDDARLPTVCKDMTLDEYIVAFRDAVLDHMRAHIFYYRKLSLMGTREELARLKETVDAVVLSQPEGAQTDEARLKEVVDSIVRIQANTARAANEYEAIDAWTSNKEAQARLHAEIAQELGLHVSEVKRAYLHGNVGPNVTRRASLTTSPRRAPPSSPRCTPTRPQTKPASAIARPSAAPSSRPSAPTRRRRRAPSPTAAPPRTERPPRGRRALGALLLTFFIKTF